METSRHLHVWPSMCCDVSPTYLHIGVAGGYKDAHARGNESAPQARKNMCTNYFATSEYVSNTSLPHQLSAEIKAKQFVTTCVRPIIFSTMYCTMWSPQVVDIDVTLDRVMRAWFEQRHECRRQLVKTIETHRGVENGERLDFTRSVRPVPYLTIHPRLITLYARIALIRVCTVSHTHPRSVFSHE